MGNAPRFCTPFALNRDEEMVIRTVYARPPGNVEPDRDPAGTFLLRPDTGAPAAGPALCPQ